MGRALRQDPLASRVSIPKFHPGPLRSTRSPDLPRSNHREATRTGGRVCTSQCTSSCESKIHPSQNQNIAPNCRQLLRISCCLVNSMWHIPLAQISRAVRDKVSSVTVLANAATNPFVSQTKKGIRSPGISLCVVMARHQPDFRFFPGLLAR